jgi:RNA polymerase primary sigma factor
MKKIDTSTEGVTNRDTRSINSYLQELRESIPLSADEEYELAVKSSEGDEQAREKLIQHNLRFVVSVAKRYQIKGVRLEDLINEGNIGLIESAKTFDPSRGFKFISYAVWKIRQKMQTYIQEHSSTIRVPVNKGSASMKIKTRVAQLEQELERVPSYNEIINHLKDDFNEEELEFYFSRHNFQATSLDVSIGNEEGSSTLIDLVINHDSTDPSNVLDKENSEYNRSLLLNKLDTREADIISLLYGFGDYEPLTAEEVANIFEVTKTVIYRVHKRALVKLKFNLQNRTKWMLEE